MIYTYEEFVAALDDMGFFLLGGSGALPKLTEMTVPGHWHTAPPQDPWDWKDVLAQRKQGAYGRIIAGQNGFCALAWLGDFISAFAPARPIQMRYEMGLVDPLSLKMHRLFEERPVWARHELTQALGIAQKQKGAFERALTRLQREMAIVVCGQSQKLAPTGRPVGWPSMEYAKMEHWISGAGISVSEPNPALARQRIVEQAQKLAPGISGSELRRLFPENP